LLLQAWN